MLNFFFFFIRQLKSFLIENFYSKQTVEELEKRLSELDKKKTKLTTPSVQSFEVSRRNARATGNSGSILEMIKKNDPELAEMIKSGDYK